ncbi:MAG: NAD(P)/FAD-dependent oxidoreductase [Longimicrobiales bacterium]
MIIGGGFGGLYCAQRLKHVGVRITLVDASNFHLFQPLLYQVATASLSPADIASPIRTVLRRQRNVEVWMGRAVEIDTERRIVHLEDGALVYDYLIVAAGATHAYFGHPEWAALAPGLKSIDDALEIRRRFLVAFEVAEREADPVARERELTFVIVGAGPTGVELAGAMAEIARTVMPNDFRFIDTKTAHIVLLEGSPHVLPTYPKELSEKTRRKLVKLGVDVRTNAMVTDIQRDSVRVGDMDIPAGNVFWAAGVAASPLGAKLGVKTDRAGRVIVEPDCSIAGHPEVFAIGDLALQQKDGKPVPGVAQGAMQMGRHAGEMIANDIAGAPRRPFRYHDKGSLATIGRAAAVADLGRIKLIGFLAWLVWAFVHIFYLIGFRNRVLVMLQWAWAWATFTRGIRLITGNPGFEIQRARAPGETTQAAAD